MGCGDDFDSFVGGELGGRIDGEEAVVERAAEFDKPVQCFIGERKEGAAEDAGQRDLIGGAGDCAEQIEDVEDFLLGIEGVAADDVVVEAVVTEGGFVDVDIAERAKQNGDIAELERASAAGSVRVGDDLFL